MLKTRLFSCSLFITHNWQYFRIKQEKWAWTLQMSFIRIDQDTRPLLTSESTMVSLGTSVSSPSSLFTKVCHKAWPVMLAVTNRKGGSLLRTEEPTYSIKYINESKVKSSICRNWIHSYEMKITLDIKSKSPLFLSSIFSWQCMYCN